MLCEFSDTILHHLTSGSFYAKMVSERNCGKMPYDLNEAKQSTYKSASRSNKCDRKRLGRRSLRRTAQRQVRRRRRYIQGQYLPQQSSRGSAMLTVFSSARLTLCRRALFCLFSPGSSSFCFSSSGWRTSARPPIPWRSPKSGA